MADGTVGAHGIYPFDSGCKSPFPTLPTDRRKIVVLACRGNGERMSRGLARASPRAPVIGVELDQADTGEPGEAMAFAAVDQFDPESDTFGTGQRGFEMMPETDEIDECPVPPVKVPGTGGNPVPPGMGEAAHIVGRRSREESHRICPLETGNGGKTRSAGDPSGDGDAKCALECALDLKHGGFLSRDPERPDPVDRDRDEDPDQDGD